MPLTKKIRLRPGGCYVYRHTDAKYYGFMITYVSKYCYFLYSGRSFVNIPSLKEFKEAGLWGHKVPTGSLTNLALTLTRDLILRKRLLDQTENIYFVGDETFNPTIEVGSGGKLEDASEIALFAKRRLAINEERKNEYLFQPHEVFSWTILSI